MELDSDPTMAKDVLTDLLEDWGWGLGKSTIHESIWYDLRFEHLTKDEKATLLDQVYDLYEKADITITVEIN